MRIAVEESLGPVDLLANAGGGACGPGRWRIFLRAEWKASVDTNLPSTFLTIKAFLPGMKQRGRGTRSMSLCRRRPPAGLPPSPWPPTPQPKRASNCSPAGSYPGRPPRRTGQLPGPRDHSYGTQPGTRIPGAVGDEFRLAHPVQRLGTPDDVAQAALSSLLTSRGGSAGSRWTSPAAPYWLEADP